MTYAPALSLKLSADDEARFWALVAKSDGCWLWTGHLDWKGYGRFHASGATRRAHRTIFAHQHGPIADRQVVCHRCDNPSCVRPSHLFLGSPKQNTADAIAKGRFVKVTPASRLQRCKRGHDLTGVNRKIGRDGQSSGCRLCKAITDRERDANRGPRNPRRMTTPPLQPLS